MISWKTSYQNGPNVSVEDPNIPLYFEAASKPPGF
jgi:hypothetical protein